jgi:outer membrane protein OmpA-like peptidoglycan-associated protein
MIIRHIQPLFYCLILLFISGCAPKTTVVLLPDPNGQVGHITVANKAGSVDITHSAEATVVAGQESKPAAPEILTEDQIAAKFSRVLATLPTQPEHFILYFQTNSTELTADSQKVLPLILQSIKNRNSENISVIGHTDTVGDRDYNFVLSKNRASSISHLLIQKGVPAADISATSHGKENPLIKTGDNVSEPRNRRVEVVIR